MSRVPLQRSVAYPDMRDIAGEGARSTQSMWTLKYVHVQPRHALHSLVAVLQTQSNSPSGVVPGGGAAVSSIEQASSSDAGGAGGPWGFGRSAACLNREIQRSTPTDLWADGPRVAKQRMRQGCLGV